MESIFILAIQSRFSCRAWKADFHAGHVEPDFMPGMKCGSTERRLGWDENKSHAGHEISIFMPGMKIEISCPAWTFFVSNPVFSRSLGTDCPWEKEHPGHELFRNMPYQIFSSMNSSLVCFQQFWVFRGMKKCVTCPTRGDTRSEVVHFPLHAMIHVKKSLWFLRSLKIIPTRAFLHASYVSKEVFVAQERSLIMFWH